MLQKLKKTMILVNAMYLGVGKSLISILEFAFKIILTVFNSTFWTSLYNTITKTLTDPNSRSTVMVVGSLLASNPALLAVIIGFTGGIAVYQNQDAIIEVINSETARYVDDFISKTEDQRLEAFGNAFGYAFAEIAQLILAFGEIKATIKALPEVIKGLEAFARVADFTKLGLLFTKLAASTGKVINRYAKYVDQAIYIAGELVTIRLLKFDNAVGIYGSDAIKFADTADTTKFTDFFSKINEGITKYNFSAFWGSSKFGVNLTKKSSSTLRTLLENSMSSSDKVQVANQLGQNINTWKDFVQANHRLPPGILRDSPEGLKTLLQSKGLTDVNDIRIMEWMKSNTNMGAHNSLWKKLVSGRKNLSAAQIESIWNQVESTPGINYEWRKTGSIVPN
jgi:hypothetical protein